MGLDTQPWKWHLLLQNNWYCAWKLSSKSKKTSRIMNSWYQIWGTWPQNCRNLNDSTTGVCGFWEWAVPTDHATCHPLILLVLCICSHCECQANKESNMEWLWSVIPAHQSSQSFGSAPLSLWRLRPRGLSRIWVTTHRVKISWSWSWGGRGGFQWFLLQFSSNVTDRGQPGACKEMALITFDGIESAATQKRERRCRGGRVQSHRGLQ